MNQSEIEFTKKWWKSVLESPAKTLALLQKWEYTFRDGYDTWNRWIRYHCNTVAGKNYRDPFTIFRQRDMSAADDYYALFTKYGVGRKSRSTAPYSPYLADMKSVVVDVKEITACALLLKTTVLERLRVLVEMQETPGEFYELFTKQLYPLEQTVEYCKTNTTPQAVERLFPYHEKYMHQFFKRDAGSVEVVKPTLTPVVQVQEVPKVAVPLHGPIFPSPPNIRTGEISDSNGGKYTFVVNLDTMAMNLPDPMSVVKISNIA